MPSNNTLFYVNSLLCFFLILPLSLSRRSWRFVVAVICERYWDERFLEKHEKVWLWNYARRWCEREFSRKMWKSQISMRTGRPEVKSRKHQNLIWKNVKSRKSEEINLNHSFRSLSFLHRYHDNWNIYFYWLFRKINFNSGALNAFD